MIRIDEIYYNTFLPKTQGRTDLAMHWFDPFGSVKWNDLCSVPPLPNSKLVTRFLFWDQEPLHRDMVDNTIKLFARMFPNGERHIVTSEHESENVEYVQNTYGLTPHYYFFHGWAALDWYRGYDRSFLMTPPAEREIKKTFIMPNRIIGGRRQHRLIMLYHIFKENMLNNHISCPAVCPAEGHDIAKLVEPLKSTYPDIAEVFAGQQLPMNFAGETDAPMHSACLSLFKECAESMIYLVTETVATGRRHHLTEKTFKPICLRMPFVIVGTQGSLAYLRSYGFKTFGDIWDETYDDETDDVKRYEKIVSIFKALDRISDSEKQRMFDQCRDIVEHNYNHFYNGGFESVLWSELTGMMDAFD